jgi:hypothetical protein
MDFASQARPTGISSTSAELLGCLKDLDPSPFCVRERPQSIKAQSLNSSPSAGDITTLRNTMDIRNFFGAKGGAPPAKPAVKKAEDTVKSSRASKLPKYPNWNLLKPYIERNVVADSDDEEQPP